MIAPAIETRGLSRRFGRKAAVAGVSLTVNRGDVFGFLGPNGAGKTTSLKMLLGLVRPTAGEGRVLGAPIGSRQARSRVGFLPEHFRFHEWLTGRELLRFHGRLQGVPKAVLRPRVEELLARVDLLDAGDRKVREYSKGMLQRIGLAQALVNEPELIFLDEPTSGLDPLGRLLVRDLIHDLRDRGTTIFLNSHLLSEVEATCNRVAFVKLGRVIREMTLNEQAQGLDVEIRLGAVGPGLVEGLARFGTGVTVEEGVVRLRAAGEEVLPEMARWLVDRGERLYEMRAARKSLETLFLEVMGDDSRPG